MAGRGTDIVLGGNPDTLAWSRLQNDYPTRLEVPQDIWDNLVREIDEQYSMAEEGEALKELGGLHVIGTERHDARRIDLQLRGRCGRQGDPGSSRFFLSLDDDLMRIFGGGNLKAILSKIGMNSEDSINSKMVTRRIESAQKKVEERNFEIRKNLLEYDEVMDTQRKRLYEFRQEILDGENVSTKVTNCLEDQIEHYVNVFLDPNYGIDSFTAWVNSTFNMQGESRTYKGMDFKQADEESRRLAYRSALRRIRDAVDENLPRDFDESEWNWQALAKFINSNWNSSLRPRDLQAIDLDDIEDDLADLAYAHIDKVDLSDGAIFLDERFGRSSLATWIRNKFGFELDEDELKDQTNDELLQSIHHRALEMYQHREAEYPVMAGIYRYGGGADKQLDREALIGWAAQRFNAEISLDSIRNMQRTELQETLVDLSLASQKRSASHRQWAQEKTAQFFDGQTENTRLNRIANEGEIASISLWLRDNVDAELDVESLGNCNSQEFRRLLSSAVEDKHHPEIRRMERALLLQIVDSSWKEHLLTMDRLRSSVGLSGYAQKDPKVEYKREGMKLYENMWFSIGEQVTDLIFRMEQLNEQFVGSTWVETSATHADAVSSSDAIRMQETGEDPSQARSAKPKTIRNATPKVGRNDPCPCGSGKKYKRCCLGS